MFHPISKQTAANVHDCRLWSQKRKGGTHTAEPSRSRGKDSASMRQAVFGPPEGAKPLCMAAGCGAEWHVAVRV